MALAVDFRDLRVYQTAFRLAMRIFELSRDWPADERDAMTGQVRRSSRAACGSIAEAWRMRRYPDHFVSKLSDPDSELAETQNWLEFAAACGYLPQQTRDALRVEYDGIARGLVAMMRKPDSWCGPAPAGPVREEPADYAVENPIPAQMVSGAPPANGSPVFYHPRTPTPSTLY